MSSRISNRSATLFLGFSVAVVLTLIGIYLTGGFTRSPIRDAENATEFVLYSLDPLAVAETDQSPTAEKLGTWPVLGRVAILEAEDRAQIAAELNAAMRDNGPHPACFLPRHAIRMVVGGRTTEYFICFECFQVEIRSDAKSNMKVINPLPQTTLNRYLVEAGVPLGAGMGEVDSVVALVRVGMTESQLKAAMHGVAIDSGTAYLGGSGSRLRYFELPDSRQVSFLVGSDEDGWKVLSPGNIEPKQTWIRHDGDSITVESISPEEVRD
ncbi:MAG: hypothetical protein WD066_03340 [Planctomycetaceae bacterium]